ncbi:ArsR/SmtB family transcription factor [Millisia brevis]|uniref:ArsR/SmtB family transcription factor n=1 Tax=Millisia brevis TaxID=264148 RepID=UPI00083365B6|nr:metalloregulator ArsR/SmtB family transcription factor [Millisia brevis]
MTKAARATDPAKETAGEQPHGDESVFPAPPEPVPPKETLEAAGELLRALAAPVRINIVLQLRRSERCVHELVGILDITQPLVSQHLRVLKSAGVVRGERVGREVLYRLVDDHLVHIVVDAIAHAEENAANHGGENR